MRRSITFLVLTFSSYAFAVDCAEVFASKTNVLSSSTGNSKSGLLGYIGGNRYFPLFKETHMSGVSGWIGKDVTEDNVVTHVRILEKDKIVDGYKSDVIEITTFRDSEGNPDLAGPYKSVYTQRVEGGEVRSKRMGRDGWGLDLVFPQDGVSFLMNGIHPYTWRYLGDWTSPVTGITYHEVFRLESTDHYAIYTPELGQIFRESPGNYRYTME